MAEFDKLYFLQLLRDALARRPLETPRYSEYLQTQVFDKLKKDGVLDLKSLNLNAVELRDLIPEHYPSMYDKTVGGWAQGLNHFFKKVPATYLKQRTFF